MSAFFLRNPWFRVTPEAASNGSSGDSYVCLAIALGIPFSPGEFHLPGNSPGTSLRVLFFFLQNKGAHAQLERL